MTNATLTVGSTVVRKTPIKMLADATGTVVKLAVWGRDEVWCDVRLRRNDVRFPNTNRLLCFSDGELTAASRSEGTRHG